MVGSDVAAALRVFRDSPREITLCHQMTAVLNSAKTPCEATCSAPGTSGHRSWKDLAVSVTVTTIGINFRSRCSMAGCFPPLSLTTYFPGNLPPWVHVPTARHRCTHADTDLYRDDTYTPVHTHSHRHTCRHMHTQNIQHGQTCTDMQK